nr:hypothetical protein GCM10025699_33860 [Microbacterium flavescens]
MLASLTSLWNRVFALLGRVSMYRVVYLALAALAVIAFVLSFFDLVGPDPLELIATLAVLSIVCGEWMPQPSASSTSRGASSRRSSPRTSCCSCWGRRST